jgi:hypothetical protein
LTCSTLKLADHIFPELRPYLEDMAELASGKVATPTFCPYAQVTEEDFQKALGGSSPSATDQDANSVTPSTGVRGTSGAVKRKPEEAKKSGKTQ